MKSIRRRLLFVAVKSVLSLIGVFAITILVHEGAHYLTARALNIPIAYFRWFDFDYYAPVLASPVTEFDTRMIAVSYAGGLVAGILLLTTVISRRSWFKRSLYRWLLGLYLMMFGAWQVSQGILEGAFHQAYIASAVNILSPISFIGYASGLVGIVLYWLIMPRFRTLPI